MFCSQFNYKTPTAEIWSLIKHFKRKKIPKSSIVPDLNLYSQLAQESIAKLSPPSCPHQLWYSLHQLIEVDKNLLNINYNLEKPFSETELDTAIQNMKLKSASGIDQIDFEVISVLPREYRTLLIKIYNSILYHGNFPNQWGHSLVVLIPKPDGGGLRPISLLSCFLKVMEKIIYNRIQWHVESQYIIPYIQLGFRPDRSCIDSLIILASDTSKGFINKSHTASAFLDIKGDFDNVIPNILIEDLANIGIPARIRMFIHNLMSSRLLHFVVDGNKHGP